MATKIHVAGWPGCPFYRRARDTVMTLQTLFPSKYELIAHEQPDRQSYRDYMEPIRVQLPDTRAHTHTSSPFVAMGEDLAGAPAACSFVGGCDDILAWAKSLFGGGPAASAAAPADMVADGFTSPNEFDYDLVVIGGGSGGLAASKEASKLGARVAVLDYVKPSPQGSQWGLGGTCVNVGCIPKKLMHQASLIGEVFRHDAARFGWTSPEGGEATVAHNWVGMRENVQNYIKSLNFKYRVALREEGVKYINGLGEFVGPNQVKVTEFKGKARTPSEKVLSSARFLIATGGRPTNLTCPGAEFAITSDDLFSLEAPPGKTCVVGAGYVALECGGFINALGMECHILVRSMLLRGFDRESCDKIGEYMTKQGVKFHMGVTPASIEKQADGKLLVTLSDGSSDLYDTVLAATGRTADTKGLNLPAIGVVADERNGKLSCVNEQTNVPNVYAIGDVLQGLPELTPVAIQAGLMLSRRLFGGASEPMDYNAVTTAVFTPIEYGTVGLTEEAAKDQLGEENLEIYISEFIPLEWSLTQERTEDVPAGFCKLICDKDSDMKIVGMHYLGPNAGEVMQGFGMAFKKGITYADVANCVGIHPTTAENFTTLTVTKSSGKSAAAAGC